MSVGSVGSISSTWQSSSTTSTSPFAQRRQDLLNLGQALQSGNLSGAQSAFTALQQSLQTSAGTVGQSSSSTTNPISTDLQSIQTALQSGSVSSGAQTAFSKLTTDLKAMGTQGTHRGHHHRGGGGAPPALTTSTDPTNSSNTTSSTSSTPTTGSTTSTSVASFLAQLVGSVVNQQA